MLVWNQLENRLELNGQRVVQWKIGWLSPRGLAETFEEYVHVCLQLDMFPDLMIRPVVIAINETGQEELIIR